MYDVAAEPDWKFTNVLTDPPFRSSEWWSVLAGAQSPLRSARGTISDVYWSSFGDYPQFTMITDRDEELTWTRQGDVSRYVVGLACEVRYVTHGWKRIVPGFEAIAADEPKIIIRVLVEESSRRSDPTPWSDSRLSREEQ